MWTLKRFWLTAFASLAILSFLSLTTHSQAFGKGGKTSSRDGAMPFAGLMMDTSGNLYGTTAIGGAYSNGTIQGNGIVFELTPPATSGGSWTESILLNFDGTDGTFPEAGLIMDAS